MRRAPTSPSRVDPEREAALAELDPLTVTKLWDNPCWLSFRLNFVAFRFNDPVYRWIETRYGLVRPEFVALYSVGLNGGVTGNWVIKRMRNFNYWAEAYSAFWDSGNPKAVPAQ